MTTCKSNVDDVCKRWHEGKSIISIGENRDDGVGIFFKEKYITIIRRRDIIPGRLLMADCFYKNEKYRLIHIYTAPEAKNKLELFRKLRELLTVGYNIILGGDFNTVTEDIDKCTTAVFKLRAEGKLLKEICSDAGLIDVCRSLNPFRMDFTRYDKTTKTRIDRIYVSNHFSVTNYRTIFNLLSPRDPGPGALPQHLAGNSV